MTSHRDFRRIPARRRDRHGDVVMRANQIVPLRIGLLWMLLVLALLALASDQGPSRRRLPSPDASPRAIVAADGAAAR
jgi:hypothetical protein